VALSLKKKLKGKIRVIATLDKNLSKTSCLHGSYGHDCYRIQNSVSSHAHIVQFCNKARLTFL